MQQYDMGSIGKYDKQNIWDTPTLIELWRTAPYSHDGKYYRLEDVFRQGEHGLSEKLTNTQILDLVIYLKSL